MLQSFVLLHFKFSLLNVFILVWQQRHFICQAVKNSSGNWVKVKISNKSAREALLSNVGAASVHKQTAAGKQFRLFWS